MSNQPDKNTHARCKDCGEFIIRLDKQDAYACKTCNKWLSKICSDRNCEFCIIRKHEPTNVNWDDKNNSFVLKKRINRDLIL